MCKFISLWHRPDNGDIAVWDLNSHSDTSEKLKLKEPLWCEGHYLPTGEVELRVTDRNFTTQKDCENRFKNRFPSFFTFLNWCLNQSILSGSLYLSGCTIPDGFKLPDTVGGSLYLAGCTFPNNFKLPDSVGGYLNLAGCTFPNNFKLPDSVGGSLYLAGCTFPDGFKLPDTVGDYLYLTGCTIPDGFKLPDTVGGSLDLSECTIPNGFKIDKKKYNII